MSGIHILTLKNKKYRIESNRNGYSLSFLSLKW
nr:MAG TPA: hypothetical protein [Caudoviricetes sp.]DAQ18565.1 MAG TPA: hypothetical protein [Caudoviricetes sp.]DAX54697.1 MAG TPA: hypothetical protein [Caudoviricetes sp.]